MKREAAETGLKQGFKRFWEDFGRGGKYYRGAGRGNRTPMTSRSRDFESRASTNSAIPAKLFLFFFRRGIITENPICGNP